MIINSINFENILHDKSFKSNCCIILHLKTIKELLMLSLDKNYYLNDDVIFLAQDLLGKIIQTEIDGIVCSGMIVETEAYKAPEDKASHAYNNRLTARTSTMFSEGGLAYIYFVYGFHNLFNVVTGPEGIPHAILIRAIQPLTNIEEMMKRRGFKHQNVNLTNGPGKLCKALGITRDFNGIDLSDTKTEISIFDDKIHIEKGDIICSPRIGIDYAQEYANKPWRFRIKGNKWTGK